MLEHCAAVHMAPDRAWIARSGDGVRQAGIGESYPFIGIDDIARRVRKTPVQFLIVHYKVEREELVKVLADVRGHREQGVKFMPVVVFSRDSDAATALDFLKMGCDDIVAFPTSVATLRERLLHHVGRKIAYVHDGDYFGLDRPNLRADADPEAGERFTVLRDVLHGIKILSQGKKAGKKAG